VDERSAWRLCAFDVDGGLRDPAVHDNFVYALEVHLERRLLVLHTEYRDGPAEQEFTDVRFVGVVAHHFEHVAGPSILLDIEQVAAAWVVERWRELFERGKNYGWPSVQHSDVGGLGEELTRQRVHGYLVMGSCGLDGFVLAAGLEYRHPERATEVSS
jgi:hypothetical protein